MLISLVSLVPWSVSIWVAKALVIILIWYFWNKRKKDIIRFAFSLAHLLTMNSLAISAAIFFLKKKKVQLFYSVVLFSAEWWNESAMHAQSCPTLCDPMDCSPPISAVHEIFQLRIMEWVDIFYSSGSSWPRDQTRVSCISCICIHESTPSWTSPTPNHPSRSHLGHPTHLGHNIAPSWAPSFI